MHSAPLLSHPQSMKNFPCCVCELSFSSARSLRRHVRAVHEGPRRVFQCQYYMEGKQTFSSRPVLEKHLQVHHRIGAAAHGLPQPSNGQISNLGCSLKYRTPGLPHRERASSSSEPDAADRQEFLCHITQHRGNADGSSHQAYCCSSCFTSTQALSRHLFIAHHLRGDTTDLFPSPTRNKVPSSSPSPPQAVPQGLDCRVCGWCFRTASDLSTHFRTHDMPFIAAQKSDRPYEEGGDGGTRA
ncbi:hypothetical protein AGOR_G00209100 [Albula goreensis]|uniref:C2H2-type domain-containing protein n=1 Tax=Albula goreensis TaxID=1534307 RepID=A0A8T3CQ70_9TELE|nr:hypothetical protein AGOR_G00209100 [Albula goreensis]